MLSRLTLFDELFPELGTDHRVLELLKQIADSGALATVGVSRHVLPVLPAARDAEAEQKRQAKQEEARERLEANRAVREQMGISS